MPISNRRRLFLAVAFLAIYLGSSCWMLSMETPRMSAENLPFTIIAFIGMIVGAWFGSHFAIGGIRR